MTKKKAPALDKVAFVRHPVSAEMKAELNAQGFKVVDAQFAGPEDKVLDGDEAPAPKKAAPKKAPAGKKAADPVKDEGGEPQA